MELERLGATTRTGALSHGYQVVVTLLLLDDSLTIIRQLLEAAILGSLAQEFLDYLESFRRPAEMEVRLG
jgi:hypothetical protein